MNTTTAPATTSTDIDLIAAVEASPRFTVVRDAGHLAELLGFDVPSEDAISILNDTALASGKERGIVAAGVIERIVPDGVQIEEINCGTDAKVRGVFLHQDDVDHMALYFFDSTASVSVHIDSHDPDEAYDGLVTPTEMFDLIRTYYRA
jgi:hypothetical protein